MSVFCQFTLPKHVLKKCFVSYPRVFTKCLQNCTILQLWVQNDSKKRFWKWAGPNIIFF